MSTKTKTKRLVIMNFSELFKQSGQLCQFSPDGQYLVSPNHTVKCREGIDGVDNLDHAQLLGMQLHASIYFIGKPAVK